MSNTMKNTTTKEDGKTALVPKLRFPEFWDAEGWEIAKFDELVDTVTPPKKLPTSHYTSKGEFPIIDQSQADICGWTDDHEALIQDGLPLIIFGDHTCILKLIDRPFAQGADGIKILKSRPKVGTPFLYQFLTYRPVVTEEYKRHYSILKEKLVAFPDPKTGEQQKIAECLSSLDELMAMQGRKLDALKTHKKGLMQQLFPHEGEAQPRLRFPEFQNAGEWEPKRLKDITDAVFDGTHQTPTYTPKGVPFYSVENLISGNANKFISRDDYLLATKKNRPEKGDVLITRIGKIGYSQVVTWDHEFSVYVTLAVIKQSKDFNSHYLHYFMQSDFYQAKLRAKSLPNAVPPKINLDSLRATEVLLTNEDEQQKIAACFSSLDELIAAETQKLDVIKVHKKGLMQQLFPSLEEVKA